MYFEFSVTFLVVLLHQPALWQQFALNPTLLTWDGFIFAESSAIANIGVNHLKGTKTFFTFLLWAVTFSFWC